MKFKNLQHNIYNVQVKSQIAQRLEDKETQPILKKKKRSILRF